jgi:hypothetical protein
MKSIIVQMKRSQIVDLNNASYDPKGIRHVPA